MLGERLNGGQSQEWRGAQSCPPSLPPSLYPWVERKNADFARSSNQLRAREVRSLSPPSLDPSSPSPPTAKIPSHSCPRDFRVVCAGICANEGRKRGISGIRIVFFYSDFT